MAIQPTNLARVCTAKWQPLWIQKGTHKYCQVFASPYNWDHTYFYDGEWKAVDNETLLVYEGSNFREYNSETDGYKVQYGNKKVETEPTPPTPVECTITIQSNNVEYGTVDVSSVTALTWTTITTEANTLTIGETTVTATAESWYQFSSWGTVPATVTWDLTITVTFEAIPVTQYTVTIVSNNTSYGTVDESELTVDSWTTLSAVSNVLSVWSTDVTATAETGYEFVSWTVGWESLPATVTANITITATFQAETPAPTGDYRYIKWHVTETMDQTGYENLQQIMASEFKLLDSSNNVMTWSNGVSATTNATDDWTTYGEIPWNLLDWNTATKMVIGWTDEPTPYDPIDVIIDLGSGNSFDPTTYNKYQWWTANDSFWGSEYHRNPTAWEIQLSTDGTTWETWDTQTNPTLVEDNQVPAGTWSLTAPSPL